MKVFFDYSVFTLQAFGGASNYFVNLVENFSDKVDPLIISPFYKNFYLKNSNYADKFFFYKKVGPLIKYINKLNKIYFNFKVNQKNPDIIHLTYFNEKNFYSSKVENVVTEHDLIKEKFYSEQYKDQIEYKKKMFDRAAQIICVSKNTKKDLQEKYSIDESKITVVYHGANESKNYREKFLNLRPFILYVGVRERYKNFTNAIKAYAKSSKLTSDFDFVCFGGGHFSDSEKDLFKTLSLDNTKLHYFEGDQLDLNFFYHKARVFIFPSLYEGFGLPLLDAMNMQCPIICSNTSCFPEIVGNSAILFDPKDLESLKFEMENLIYDDQLLLNLKKRGLNNVKNYKWKKCAEETEKIYKKIV